MAAETKRQPRNRLLELLSKSTKKRLLEQCESVHLALKEVLYESSQPMAYVYFPLNGIISLVATMDNGVAIEVATTGNEGIMGLPLFLGVEQTPLKALSQVPGDSLRLAAPKFRTFLKQEPELSAVLHRFAQALMMQVSQSTACNRAHTVEQRCCRWLLMTHDRVNREDFALTQEFLAQMLGVRRATVGEIAGELQNAKLIQYSRGLIRILNRRGWNGVAAAVPLSFGMNTSACRTATGSHDLY